MPLKSMEPFGLALKDFYKGDKRAKVIFYRDDGFKEDHYVSNYFRTGKEFSALENHAILLCQGKVLDIGAGVGPHALELQNLGFDVLAIDISAHACEVMKKRGVKNVKCASVYDLNEKGFGTILLMGRSIGFVEDLPGLKKFLKFSKNLLNPDGYILLDSLDVRITTNPNHLSYHERNINLGFYFGEIRLYMEYKGLLGEKFQLLFIDPQTLKTIAREVGLKCDVVHDEKNGDYLAKIFR
jgi:SAM-dependent methyltransferase